MPHKAEYDKMVVDNRMASHILKVVAFVLFYTKPMIKSPSRDQLKYLDMKQNDLKLLKAMVTEAVPLFTG